MPTNEQLTSWEANHADELRQVWSDLIGGEDGTAEPMFYREPISAAQAGYVFQTWVIQAFKLGNVDIEPPFSVAREPGANEQTLAELDGFAILDEHRFIVESKFQQVNFDPIARLHLLAEQRPIGTMGLLFAAKGFTGAAIESAHMLRPMRVLLFDRVDMNYIAEAADISTAIRVKWRRANMHARPNLPVTPDG